MGLLVSHYEANPITNNNIRIDAVSGTLTKTFRESYFVRFQRGSKMECYYLTEDIAKNTKGKEIIILQIMLAFDNNYIVEVINKEDYDKMFNNNLESDVN